MLGLELVVVLGVALLACSVVARRTRVAPPVVQLTGGVLLGFVPALRDVHLPPETVLLLFLPALLWWESLTSSLREIRRDLRGIVLMGTLLVVVTAAAVATVAHALGVPWGPAWVLGAAVAPTDATAVGVLARRLPRRNVTLLQAESLVNDGTALVIYGLAVGIVLGEEQATASHVAELFAVSYVGGVAAGVLVAVVGARLRRHLVEVLDGNVLMILIPFAAFLLAETVRASGVLAVVTAGLLTSQSGPRIGRADTRQHVQAFWTVATYLLNGALFVLVGVEAQAAVRSLETSEIGRAAAGVALVTATVVVVRLAFLFGVSTLIRLVDRRPAQRLRRVGARSRVLSGLTGFRGAVSLAAALAVPAVLDAGGPFPERDFIVVVTAGVVTATLVLQGLLLPAVVRWAHLPADEALGQEHQLAQEEATTRALESLPGVAAELGVDDDVAERLRAEYAEHLHVVRTGDRDLTSDDPAVRRELQYVALRLALLDRKRSTVVALRDAGRIDDTVLRHHQSRLDVEEVRLRRPDGVD